MGDHDWSVIDESSSTDAQSFLAGALPLSLPDNALSPDGPCFKAFLFPSPHTWPPSSTHYSFLQPLTMIDFFVTCALVPPSHQTTPLPSVFETVRKWHPVMKLIFKKNCSSSPAFVPLSRSIGKTVVLKDWTSFRLSLDRSWISQPTVFFSLGYSSRVASQSSLPTLEWTFIKDSSSITTQYSSFFLICLSEFLSYILHFDW